MHLAKYSQHIYSNFILVILKSKFYPSNRLSKIIFTSSLDESSSFIFLTLILSFVNAIALLEISMFADDLNS
jgi:hypothetical protein